MATAGAAALLAALGLMSPPVASASTPDALANSAQQIAALQAIKTTETPAESKVDSKLLVQQKLSAKRLSANTLPALQSGTNVSPSGTVSVDIRATKVTPDLISGLTKAGAGIRAVSDQYASIRADLPVAAISEIAARGDVKRVEQADQAGAEADDFLFIVEPQIRGP